MNILQRTRASSVATSGAADPKNLKDLEHYYKALKKNVLDFQFEFIVALKKNNKVRTLLVNLKEKSIQIIKMSKKQKHKKSKIKKYGIDEFDRITKVKNENKLISFSRKNGKKEFGVSFINTERRECFYELLWLARSGATALPDREEQTLFDTINIFVSTWNVGDAQPRADQLHTWIPAGNSTTGDRKQQIDLYAIGVQECHYDPLPKREHSDDDRCEEHWFSMLATHIGSDYVRLESISLVKMRLILFVRKEHYYKINHIEKDSEATGIGGIYGNKGATAISFQFLETSFCFISSHFAAHQEKSEQRNRNYRDIVKGLNLGNKSSDVLNQFHHVIWMGDFNYRVDLFREEVLNLVKKNNIAKILTKDQLAVQKKMERVFLGFKEASIQFMPTYKLERGQKGVYTEEKQRVPSWCDRILWKSLPYTQPISPVSYSSAPDISTSDHIPVYSLLSAYIQRPCLPVPQSLIRQLRIYFYDLKAENLVGKKSKIDEKDKEKDKDKDKDNKDHPPSPYLVFNACSYVEEPVSTSVVYHNSNPLWGNIAPIVPIIQKKTFLEHQHLFITIFDENESKSKKERKLKKRLIGHATVPLALGFNSEPYSFKTRITKYGLNSGILYGKIHILYDNAAHTPPLIPMHSNSYMAKESVANEVAYGPIVPPPPPIVTLPPPPPTIITTTTTTINYYSNNNNSDNSSSTDNSYTTTPPSNEYEYNYENNYNSYQDDDNYSNDNNNNINSITVQMESTTIDDTITLSPGSNRPMLRRSKSFRKSI
ncbi:inositol 5-phosphatase [Heterostelium album PN500]|uniref:Inositol 5-phosphatase n=1 Tax=Heterostelium pallidum (strain ATCC 26659 / Pp 5 / PN500) TaxID=670386 RepID=D3BF37_HETP5|nr:inositol 5-phosphatase [Heterostelium album PN500]EFA80518.1 inositol 5-phosphatase [Heterostelium album PN500]|eukprot:XP_020432638.1 inositol 5-phosphatase [Heterostelium album PN500]